MKFRRERATLARDYPSAKPARDTLRALNLKLAANLKFYRATAVKFNTGEISKIIKFQEIL